MSIGAELPLPSEVDRLLRVPFRFEDYLGLPHDHRAEYVDEMAIVSPSAIASHQRISRRIANLIESGCPSLFVVEAVGVWTGERRGRIPDVHATERPFDGSWADQTPVLVVEILSPSTRGEDTLRKSVEYREAGISQYWIVDREHRTVTVLSNGDDGWEVHAEVDDARPRVTALVGGHGEVTLDLSMLFAV